MARRRRRLERDGAPRLALRRKRRRPTDARSQGTPRRERELRKEANRRPRPNRAVRSSPPRTKTPRPNERQAVRGLPSLPRARKKELIHRERQAEGSGLTGWGSWTNTIPRKSKSSA